MFNRVLFIGAHADDVELFAGGLLSRLSREKLPIRVLTFSAHKGVGIPDVSDKAREEHVSNMSRIGVSFDLHDLPACAGTFEANRGYLYGQIQSAVSEFVPTCIVTHPLDDTNQDHQQVVAECLRVCKGGQSIIHGEYPFNQVRPIAGSVYVRLEKSDIDLKESLICGYKSQNRVGRNYFRPGIWSGYASMLGALCGWDYAERFYVSRIRYE